MRWFGDDAALTEELQGVRKDLQELTARKLTLAKDVELTEAVVRLKTEISDLKIDKARLTETHAKEDRELRHMIGLEKKRQEFEVAAAKRDSTLTVREENLSADRKRFADEMAFQRTRFEEEVNYLKGMMGQILERLPNVTMALGRGGVKK